MDVLSLAVSGAQTWIEFFGAHFVRDGKTKIAVQFEAYRQDDGTLHWFVIPHYDMPLVRMVS